MARTRSEEGATPSDIETLTFEQALAELEGIVKALESGQGALEASVAAYQRGAALRAHCERKLAEAEQKVQAIVEGPSGLSLRDVE
ncbi:exodeoxyribonuclease VII small subunit [Roseomonas alkaliterrae]|jgi:exodeoxyribonuclease VII small subunit|uniref:Exodeoxyribonuclease 7 small subunit n=1 Tax=Neoroseomonas alkaliterrae TaxID=1452450 RepID=A0A840XVN7_9PROT|nr:exodeoxyribonuclease VII small subunit [Neoroseomonas alkaliterrae]MBB5690699.1 exodeoxyribonuclease VII small subunit [Neoroseomonas alkaliterrae]MBR0675409.1 exodeoxyribonuclease VII small subunit [Neoroseomonas alkaliterrae]